MNDLNESELINVEPSEKRLKRIWNNSIKNGEITPATGKAIGIVLGGQLLLLFKSGINLLTRFGKTNPINFDKNLNSISGSLSNKKAA